MKREVVVIKEIFGPAQKAFLSVYGDKHHRARLSRRLYIELGSPILVDIAQVEGEDVLLIRKGKTIPVARDRILTSAGLAGVPRGRYVLEGVFRAEEGDWYVLRLGGEDEQA